VNRPGAQTGTPSSRPLHVWAIATIVSLVAVGMSWACTVPAQHWWREMGVQLPGLSELWIAPSWHWVSAVLMAGSALLIRIRGHFVLGLCLWGASFVLFLAITALTVFMPLFPPHCLHG
jgi:hypothetical protein